MEYLSSEKTSHTVDAYMRQIVDVATSTKVWILQGPDTVNYVSENVNVLPDWSRLL